MVWKILILANLLALALVSCAAEQAIAPRLAQEQVNRAWRREQHAVWELDWPAAPPGGPLTAAVWRAGGQYRFEILESAAPALVGETLIFDGQTGWLYNRFEASPPVATSSPQLSPVSEAFKIIDRLTDLTPIAATRQESTTLDHGPAEKIELAFENGDRLAVWIDQKTELPVRLAFWVGGSQANLKARRNEPLVASPEGLFEPDLAVSR